VEALVQRGVRPGLTVIIALAGLVALLGLAITRPREDPGRLIAALPPVAAVTSILFLSVAYPSSDGDTITIGATSSSSTAASPISSARLVASPAWNARIRGRADATAAYTFW
jgi:hypothetical protein